jgi:hypothetical protein
VYPAQDTTYELFAQGSAFNIRDILTVKGVRRVMNFFHEARLDGLVRREEALGSKTVEVYRGRDDRLVYRSARYQPPEPGAVVEEEEEAPPPAAAAAPPDPFEMETSSRKIPPIPLLKIAEKYERAPGLDADADVARRVFHIADDRIQLVFHFGDNRVTASSRIFEKGGSCTPVQANPMADPIPQTTLVEEFHALLRAEKASVAAVRESELEVREVLKTRIAQEQAVALQVRARAARCPPRFSRPPAAHAAAAARRRPRARAASCRRRRRAVPFL